MKTQDELKRQLKQIDHKGYKAYKILEGEYNFGTYILCIDHVQGDPFATPSRVRLLYKNSIPEEYFASRHRKMAAEDYLLRRLHRNLRSGGQERRGSGKSGMVTACRTGQEVLERTAVLLSDGTVEGVWKWASLPMEEPLPQENWNRFYLAFFRRRPGGPLSSGLG